MLSSILLLIELLLRALETNSAHIEPFWNDRLTSMVWDTIDTLVNEVSLHHAILYLAIYIELLLRALETNSAHIEPVWDTIDTLVNEVSLHHAILYLAIYIELLLRALETNSAHIEPVWDTIDTLVNEVSLHHAILYLAIYIELLLRALETNSAHIEPVWDTIDTLVNEVSLHHASLYLAIYIELLLRALETNSAHIEPVWDTIDTLVNEVSLHHAILYLAIYIELLLRALETNSAHIEPVWDTIDTLVNEVIIETSNQHCEGAILAATRNELVPMILLLLVQCIPLCDEKNLEQVLSISTELIDHYHISQQTVRLSPALLCSYITCLLPWLYTLRSSETLKATLYRFVQMIINTSLLCNESTKESHFNSESIHSAQDSIPLSFNQWSEHRQLLLFSNERIMTAHCLIGKLNQGDMDSWETELEPFPGLDCLVAGHLTAKCVSSSLEYDSHGIDAVHDKQWRFLIAQTPSNALYLILWLLTRERQPLGIHHWLNLLVQTARDKDNIPHILNTLESLKLTRDPSVMSRLITLYTSLWSIEPRTFQFLLPLLDRNTSDMKPWLFDVVRASAMRTVCREQ
ncbi:hypothetical protein WDU94_000200 [Cyamophila willieti]